MKTRRGKDKSAGMMNIDKHKHFVLSFLEIFKARKFGMGFLGVNFVSGIFLGFVGSPKGFLRFDFCPHLIIPVTLNSEYLPGFAASLSI